jgi:hypothetical protein
LERIHQLKDPPYVDVSIYWIAGSTGYRVESLVGSPNGAYSTAKASGWFSVTTGAASASESSSGHVQSAGYGILKSDQYSAATRTATAPEDSNRPGTSVEAHHAGSEHGRAVASGAIEFSMQVPGPVKKQVGDIDLGWQWERPSLDRSPDTLSGGERACERLLDVLETDKPNPDQVRQQVEALRKVREQRQAELRQARQQLRGIVTPEQEAKLILMGYLE